MFNKLRSKFKDENFVRGFICVIGAILIIAISWLAVIPSFADEGVTPRATPTDLTGYTVTVPAGWSAPASYGEFFYDGYIVESGAGEIIENNSFRIGWSASMPDFILSPTVNSVLDGYSLVTYTPSSSLTFVFSSSGSPSLIQWFVDNNATFVGGSTPEPETSSIAGGIYHFKTFGNLPEIPDAGWSDGQGYTYSYTLAGKYVTTSRTIAFTGFNITFDEYVSNSHYTVTFSVDTDDGVIDLATYSASYGQIELETRADLKYLVFDEALIGSYNDIEFIRQFLVSGLPDTDTSPTDNPWAYILEMIIEALKVDLFGYFSVWDIFTTICGIFIVTWLLKLLAGG